MVNFRDPIEIAKYDCGYISHFVYRHTESLFLTSRTFEVLARGGWYLYVRPRGTSHFLSRVSLNSRTHL